MTVTHITECDNPGCPEVFRYRHGEEKSDDGWLEVYTDEDDNLDFCSRVCLVEYYHPEIQEDD